MHATVNDDSSSVGGRTLLDVSSTEEITSLGQTLNLFEIWLQSSEKIYLQKTTM